MNVKSIRCQEGLHEQCVSGDVCICSCHSSKQASLPKCNGCGLLPLPLMMHEVNTPRGIVLGLVCCAECGHVHQVLVIGMVEAQLVDAKGRGVAPMVRQ